jgi:hypothetical protein
MNPDLFELHAMRICFLSSAPVKHVGPDLGLWLSPKRDERTPCGRDRDEIGEQFPATLAVASHEHWTRAQSATKANPWLTSLYSVRGCREGHIFRCRKRVFWLCKAIFRAYGPIFRAIRELCTPLLSYVAQD